MTSTEQEACEKRVPDWAWISVPAVSLGAVAVSVVLVYLQVSGSYLPGILGCVVASFILAGIALLKPRRDIVSLLAPMYAIIIFNPFGGFNIEGIMLQLLYAITITAVAYRLEKRYS